MAKKIKAKSKKKSSLSFFPKSSWKALLLGTALGISSQRIPEVKSYTDELMQPLEHQLGDLYASRTTVVTGMPVSYFPLSRSGYSLTYDALHRNPLWVYEHLTAENLKGEVDRSHFDFKEDEHIPSRLRATVADYKGQGFDRGHMAPAANHSSTPTEMKDTFLMTNMCPQCPSFNRGYWAKFERHVRDLTKMYAHVYVVTGPLYVPHHESDGRYVKYQVIGSNDVAVPTHFFKVITLEDHQGKKETRAYILENQEISMQTSLDSFRTTVQKVEKLAGFVFVQH